MTRFLVMTVFPLLVVYAAIGDIRTMRIPNWLNGLIIAAFFPVAFLAGMPFEVMVWHFAAFGVLLVAGMALFMTGKFGGGDAKMLAAAGLWMGWQAMTMYLVYTALAGGLLAIIMKAWQMLRIEQGIWGQDGALRKIFARNLDLPYGAAIAAGALLAFTETWWTSVIS